MAIFGVDHEEFDSFKSDVQSKLSALNEKITSKITDSEEAARASAESASKYESLARASGTAVSAALQDLDKFKDGALQEFQELQKYRTEAESKIKEIEEGINSAKNEYERFIGLKGNVDKQIEDVSLKAKAADSILEQVEELPDLLAKTQKALTDAKAIGESINNVLNHAAARKAEIDELHKKIYGEDLKDDDGKSHHVDGIKDELEKSLTALNERSEKLSDVIDKVTSEITTKHQSSLSEEKLKFEQLIADSTARYTAVDKELKGLLPGSMAAGLSAAYEKKKDEESRSLVNFESRFRNSIIAMVSISLIPFCIDIYLLAFQGNSLVQVIKDTPNLIVAILPIYFPVLWLAYSTNKKLNLSKRLIEEYTHKAVLGKTFSGLANQIQELPHQEAIKDELRTRLLFNVLQVSAENPGKLITDYNKADHPLMEALEKSAKLSDAVETLSKIPGFSPLAKRLAERSDDLLAKQTERVERGLATELSRKQRANEEVGDNKGGRVETA